MTLPMSMRAGAASRSPGCTTTVSRPARVRGSIFSRLNSPTPAPPCSPAFWQSTSTWANRPPTRPGALGEKTRSNRGRGVDRRPVLGTQRRRVYVSALLAPCSFPSALRRGADRGRTVPPALPRFERHRAVACEQAASPCWSAQTFWRRVSRHALSPLLSERSERFGGGTRASASVGGGTLSILFPTPC